MGERRRRKYQKIDAIQIAAATQKPIACKNIANLLKNSLQKHRQANRHNPQKHMHSLMGNKLPIGTARRPSAKFGKPPRLQTSYPQGAEARQGQKDNRLWFEVVQAHAHDHHLKEKG